MTRTNLTLPPTASPSAPVATPAFAPPYAHYTYQSWDAGANVWYDVSGNGFHSNTATGTITAVSDTASGGLNYLSGGTADSICLSDSDIIATTFTICSLSKYINATNRQRIIRGRDTNWLHGHWGGRAGVAYYGDGSGWQVSASSIVSDASAWILFCAQNGGDGYFRANGLTEAQSTSGVGNERLCVNTGSYHSSEVSDWAVAEIITWDYALSLEEIQEVEAHLSNKSSIALTAQPTVAPTSQCEGVMTQHLVDDWTAAVQSQIIGYIDTADNYRVEFDMSIDNSINFGSTTWHSVLHIGSTDTCVLRASSDIS